ncbi:MAG: hypothetical protein ABSA26_07885, partial [Thermoguttaceae bacterium]
ENQKSANDAEEAFFFTKAGLPRVIKQAGADKTTQLRDGTLFFLLSGISLLGNKPGMEEYS